MNRRTTLLDRSELRGGLATTTEIATPGGWTSMGDLQPGDEVFDENGRPTKVLSVSHAIEGCDCFEVAFSDKWVLVAAADQLWVTETRAERKRRAPNYVKRYPERFVGTKAEQRAVATLMQSPEPQLVTRQALAEELGPDHAHPYARVVRASNWCKPVGTRGGGARLYVRQDVLSVLAQMLGKRTGPWRRPASGPITTTQVARTLRVGGSHRRHGVLIAPALALPEADLPLAPRLLGLWLGDGASGSAQFTTADYELVQEFRAAGYHIERIEGSRYDYGISSMSSKDRVRPHPVPCQACGRIIPPAYYRRWLCEDCVHRYKMRVDLSAARRRLCECGKALDPQAWGTKCRECLNCGSFHHQLRKLDLLRNKHVPIVYLRASVWQRRALLSGLLDTDGTVGTAGQVEYDSTSARLGTDVHELVCSLGYRATMHEARATLRGKDYGPKWTVTFTTRDEIFGLNRKRVAQAARLTDANGSRTRLRYVVDVRPVGAAATSRIRVENPTGLFLAGRGFVATHDAVKRNGV